MKALHPLAAAMLAVFALCATLALAADLGQRDAAVQFAAQGAPVLQVYSPGDAGPPKLDEDAVAAFRTVNGVRTAIAVDEVPVTLSGLDYALPVTVYAVPEEKLQSLSLPLGSGTLPDSPWRAQALCGSALAAKLAEAADRVGRPLPGTVCLGVEGGGTLEVQLSGVAQPTGTVRDDGLWLDTGMVHALLPEERRADPLPVTRVEVEARSVAAAPAVADALRQQGYLVTNPVEAHARTLADGAAMARQWGILAALAFLSTAFTLWRKPPQRLLPAMLLSLGAVAGGAALAAMLMQVAMLLDARFFLSPDARYLLDVPRVLAVGLAACGAVGVAGCLAPLRRNGR